MSKRAWLGALGSFVAAGLAGLVACSGPTVAIGGLDDAGTSPVAEGPATTADAGEAITDAAALPPPPVQPTDGVIVLDIAPVRPGQQPMAGRLAVVWTQMNDDGPDPAPEVVYDVPFAGTETQIAIPLSALGRPSEANLYCPRACVDESVCPCTGGPKLGFAYVAVFADTNGDGRSTVAYSSRDSDTSLGMAYAFLVSSEVPYAAPPGNLGEMFPDGIAAGLNAYRVVDVDASSFDVLTTPSVSGRYEIKVCDTTDRAVCDPDGPNLS